MTDDRIPLPDVTGLDRETAERLISMRRDPGYATENVTPITALDQSTIDALWGELRATLHQHDAYGWKGCSICRRLEAERVSRRFPDDTLQAVNRPQGERFG